MTSNARTRTPTGSHAHAYDSLIPLRMPDIPTPCSSTPSSIARTVPSKPTHASVLAAARMLRHAARLRLDEKRRSRMAVGDRRWRKHARLWCRLVRQRPTIGYRHSLSGGSCRPLRPPTPKQAPAPLCCSAPLSLSFSLRAGISWPARCSCLGLPPAHKPTLLQPSCLHPTPYTLRPKP